MSAVVVDLSVRDLAQDDLQWCSWAGSALHLAQVARDGVIRRHETVCTLMGKTLT